MLGDPQCRYKVPIDVLGAVFHNCAYRQLLVAGRAQLSRYYDVKTCTQPPGDYVCNMTPPLGMPMVVSSAFCRDGSFSASATPASPLSRNFTSKGGGHYF